MLGALRAALRCLLHERDRRQDGALRSLTPLTSQGAILGLDQVFKGHLLFNKLAAGPLTILLNGAAVPPPLQPTLDTLRKAGHDVVDPAIAKLEPLDDGVRVHFTDGTAPRSFGFIAHQPDKALPPSSQAIVDALGLTTTAPMPGAVTVVQSEFLGLSMGSTAVPGVFVAGDIGQTVTLASQALASGVKVAGFALMLLALGELGLSFPMPPSVTPATA